MRKRKIYYVPGIISLIGLPLIFLILQPEDRPIPSAIRLFLPAEDKPGDTEKRYTRSYVQEALKGKKIVQVEFWYQPYGDLEEFQKNRKMNFIISEIERLTFTNDTCTVLKIAFGESSSYGEFVTIQNYLMLYGVKRYAFLDDALFIFANEPPPNPADYPPLELNIGVIEPTEKWQPPGSFQILMTRIKEETKIRWLEIKLNPFLFCSYIFLICLPVVFRLFIKREPALPR